MLMLKHNNKSHTQNHNFLPYHTTHLNIITTTRMFSRLKKKTENEGEALQQIKSENNNINSKQKKSKNSKKKKKNKVTDDEVLRAERVVSTRASLSRSEAANVIKARKVAYKETDDNDTPLIPIKSTKLKIPMNAVIYINGKPLPPIPPLLIAYHKPKNVLSAMDEKHSLSKKHLGMFLSPTYKKIGMHPVGRLDYDTSGLILFSRNGDLTQRLLHPKYEIEKEYVATVPGKVNTGGSGQDNNDMDFDELKRQLEEDGVETSEGTHFAKLVDVQKLDLQESQTILEKYLKGRKEKGAEEKDSRILASASSETELFNIRLVVQEGKYRMVRRMLSNCGHPVIELKRERHGLVELKDLEIGEFRDCSEDELEWASGLFASKDKK